MSLKLFTTSGGANNSSSKPDIENEEENKELMANDATLSGQAIQPIITRSRSGLSITSRILLDEQPSAIERYKHIALKTHKDKAFFKELEKSKISDDKRHIAFVELKLTRISEINTSNETFWLSFFNVVNMACIKNRC